MLHLAYANRMERLVEPLTARIAAAQRARPMAPVHVVVPNPAVGQFVRFRVAEQLGIAANLEFVFLRRFLSDAVEQASDDLMVVDADNLTLVLYARFMDPAFLAPEALAPVRAYLGADPEARPLRALQLAEQTARLFEEYGYSRRRMLQRWRHGPTLADTPWARTEAWQAWLWLTSFDADGRLRVAAEPVDTAQLSLLPEATPIRGPRHLMLTDALASADPAKLALPEVIHVFGLSYVAPAFAEVFARLAQTRTLAVYAINPCLEFWEDVDQIPLAERAGWAHRGQKLAGSLNAEADPFGLDRAGDTPALRLWGRPGREYIRLLNQLTECVFDAGFTDPRADGATLLSQLQLDILVRAPERPWLDDHAPPPDDSIRFLACPGVRREVEIVADEIWALVADPVAAIRFHEIAVMVTDANREAYLTHVASVFRERHDLPFNVIDGRLSAHTRVIEAIERLLDLPTTDFAYNELLPLLTHPAIGGPRGDPARWRRWLDALQIRFGADRDDLAGTYLDRDVHNWDQALRRLVVGAFMRGEASGEAAPFTTSVGAWLPFETAPDDLGEVAALVDLARRLITDAKRLVAARLPVRDWAVLLARYIGVVHAEDVTDEIALARCGQALEALAAADLEGVVVDYGVARELFRRRLGGLEARRGQHQADGVVVSSLLPMRAIPFKVIFVLGLGEGDFPAAARNDPLDLRQARRVPGDVSPAERDRYLFLETVLACRGRLRLSYVARDPQTGETIEPASVVRELQFILRGYLGAEALSAMTRRYPLSPYDREALEADAERAPSVSPEAWVGGQARALRADLEAHLGRPPPEGAALLDQLSDAARAALTPVLRPPPRPAFEPTQRGPIRLSVAAIRRFLESPLQGSAQTVLGLYDDAHEGLEEELDEPLRFDRWSAVSLLREAFWAGAGDAARIERAYRERFEQRALRGEAPVGLFAEMAHGRDLATLRGWLHNVAELGVADLATWVQARLGRADEHEAVDVIHPALELAVPVAGAVVPVTVVGGLSPYRPDGSATLRCLTNLAVDEKHFFPGFLSMMVLAAAGGPVGDHFHVGVIPAPPTEGKRMRRAYAVPPRAEIRHWLTDVVSDLLSGVHDYRLPIDQVIRWNAELRVKPRATLPYMAREDFNSDAYGPVRRPYDFRALDEETASQVVERRLAFWFRAARG